MHDSVDQFRSLEQNKNLYPLLDGAKKNTKKDKRILN